MSTSEGRLVLASASPRRLDLLRQIDYPPDTVDPAELDETPGPDETPPPVSRFRSRTKRAPIAC